MNIPKLQNENKSALFFVMVAVLLILLVIKVPLFVVKIMTAFFMCIVFVLNILVFFEGKRNTEKKVSQLKISLATPFMVIMCGSFSLIFSLQYFRNSVEKNKIISRNFFNERGIFLFVLEMIVFLCAMFFILNLCKKVKKNSFEKLSQAVDEAGVEKKSCIKKINDSAVMVNNLSVFSATSSFNFGISKSVCIIQFLSMIFYFFKDYFIEDFFSFEEFSKKIEVAIIFSLSLFTIILLLAVALKKAVDNICN